MFNKFSIKIQDNGKGISPADIEKLFHNYAKLKDTDAVNKNGTGLGLSICK